MTQVQVLTAESRRRGTRTTGASAAGSPEDLPNGLDWQAFSTAYFPGRGRHDFEALIAYGAYRRSRRGDESLPEGAGRPGEAKSDAGGPAALRVWEGEGGATL